MTEPASVEMPSASTLALHSEAMAHKPSPFAYWQWRVSELEDVLRKTRAYLDEMSDYPEPGDTIAMIDAALSKLEKGNG